MSQDFDDLRDGHRDAIEKVKILREALRSVGVEVSAYEAGVIARWDWPTLAVVASLVTRVAAAAPQGAPQSRR